MACFPTSPRVCIVFSGEGGVKSSFNTYWLYKARTCQRVFKQWSVLCALFCIQMRALCCRRKSMVLIPLVVHVHYLAMSSTESPESNFGYLNLFINGVSMGRYARAAQ